MSYSNIINYTASATNAASVIYTANTINIPIQSTSQSTPKTNWNVERAKEWMHDAGMDHIRDGLYEEGGKLIYHSKWGTYCNSEDFFRKGLKIICKWDAADIEEVIVDLRWWDR